MMKCKQCGGHARWMFPLIGMAAFECESCGTLEPDAVESIPPMSANRALGQRRADTENFVLGTLNEFMNHRITFADAVKQLTDRIHQPDNA